MTNIEYWRTQASLIVIPSSFDSGVYEIDFNRYDRFEDNQFLTREQLVEVLNLKSSKVIVLNRRGNKIVFKNFLTIAEVIG